MEWIERNPKNQQARNEASAAYQASYERALNRGRMELRDVYGTYSDAKHDAYKEVKASASDGYDLDGTWVIPTANTFVFTMLAPAVSKADGHCVWLYATSTKRLVRDRLTEETA